MTDYVFEDAIGLRPYDEALVNYFSLKLFPDPANKQEWITLVPTMTPRREFAIQDDIRQTSLYEEKSGQENYTIAVPALALSRLNFDQDKSRWSNAGYRKIKYTEDGNRILQSEDPYPVKIMYQLDAWLKYQSHANQIIRNILLRFTHNEVWLPIDLKGEFGIQHIPLELVGGPKNLTNLDPGDQERSIRYAFTLIFRGFIVPDVTSIPTVRKAVTGYYIAAKNTAKIPTTNDEMDAAYLDWLKLKDVVSTDEETDPSLGNP